MTFCETIKYDPFGIPEGGGDQRCGLGGGLSRLLVITAVNDGNGVCQDPAILQLYGEGHIGFLQMMWRVRSWKPWHNTSSLIATGSRWIRCTVL